MLNGVTYKDFMKNMNFTIKQVKNIYVSQNYTTRVYVRQNIYFVNAYFVMLNR